MVMLGCKKQGILYLPSSLFPRSCTESRALYRPIIGRARSFLRDRPPSLSISADQAGTLHLSIIIIIRHPFKSLLPVLVQRQHFFRD